MTVILSQPARSDLHAITFNNKGTPKDTVGLVYWGAQHALAPASNRLAGYFTGLRPEQRRATYPSLPFSTGVQRDGGQYGITLDSWTLRRDLGARRLGTIVMQFAPKEKLFPFPFAGERNEVCMSFDLKVPSSFTLAGGVTQVTAYVHLVDKTTKSGLWLGLSCFDSRGVQRGRDVAHFDTGGTNQPILVGYAGQPTALALGVAGSHFSCAFSDYRSFRWRIDWGVVEAAVAASMLRGVSFDPASYYIDNFNLNPEIYVPRGLLSYAHISLAVRNWKVEVI